MSSFDVESGVSLSTGRRRRDDDDDDDDYADDDYDEIIGDAYERREDTPLNDERYSVNLGPGESFNSDGDVVDISGLLEAGGSKTKHHLPPSVQQFHFFHHDDNVRVPDDVFETLQKQYDVLYVGGALDNPEEENGKLYGGNMFLPFITPGCEGQERKIADQSKIDEQWTAIRRRGFWPNQYWPSRVAYDMFFRVTAMLMLLGAAIVMTVLKADGNQRFQSEVFLTTDFLVNGVQPTPANGLAFHIGNLPLAWISVFCMFAMAIGHFAFSGFIGLLGSIVGITGPALNAVFDRIFMMENFPFWYQINIVENMMLAFDPLKLPMAILGQSVAVTMVLAVIGMNNMIELVMFFGVNVLMSIGFDFAHEYNISKFMYVLGYALPMYAVRRANGQLDELYTHNRAEVTYGGDQCVTTAHRLVVEPDLMWHGLAVGTQNLRQLIGMPPAVSDSTEAKYRDFVSTVRQRERLPDAVGIRDELEKPAAGSEGGRRFGMAEFYAIEELKDDYREAINHGGHMAGGWAAWAIIIVVSFSYYFGAIHQDSGSFDTWQHFAFWIAMAAVTYKGIINAVRWYDVEGRSDTWPQRLLRWLPNILSLHHVISAAVTITLFYLVVTGSTADIVNS